MQQRKKMLGVLSFAFLASIWSKVSFDPDFLRVSGIFTLTFLAFQEMLV